MPQYDEVPSASSPAIAHLVSPPVSSIPDTYNSRVMAIREVRDLTRHITGRIKTLIDASIIDPVQRKAIKDLVHEAIWSDYASVVTWVDRQIEIEMAAVVEYDRRRNASDPNSSVGSAGPHPIPPQMWENVVTARYIGENAAWNVFPFSRTQGPEVVE